MDHDTIELLRHPNFGFLATIRSDSTPQLTPVWVDTDGTYVIINTTKDRAKFRNLKRNPHAVLGIADRNNPYKKVVIYGKAVEFTEEGADEHIDKLAKKYLGSDKYPRSSPTERRIIVKIKPERIIK